MRIRQEQIDTFVKSRDDAYMAGLVEHLRDDFREARTANGIEDDDIEPLIRRGIQNAKKYGVVGDADVLRFLECMVILGPEFDRDKEIPWAGEILRADTDGSVKMDEIDEYMLFALEEPV